MRKPWLLVLFCVFATATGSSWEDLEKDCQDDVDQESMLDHGSEYYYQYQSEGIGQAVGTTDHATKMIIKCSVHISHIKSCIFSLQLSECTLTALGGPPHAEQAWMNSYNLSILSRNPTLFSLSSGEVKGVYVDNNDPLHSVNIKRGILSAFVIKKSAAFGSFHEMHTDIHGTCPWKASLSAGEAGYIKSSKDMLHCAFPSRPDWYFSPWSIFWNMSFIQYVINSSVDCDYNLNLNQRRLVSIICKERHAIMLESTHNTTTAVQTNIHYSMKLVEIKSIENLPPTIAVGRRTGIQFEYNSTPDPVEQPPGFLETAERLITDLVKTSEGEIHLFTIPMFHDLVAWLRSSSDLLPFVQSVTSCSFIIDCPERVKVLAMSYLRDSLVQCNTIPCIKSFTKLVLSDHVSPIYLRVVLFSWINTYNIRPVHIEETLKICKYTQHRVCWLHLGRLVNKFTKENPSTKQSGVLPEIKKVVNHMYDQLGIRCDSSDIIYPEYYTEQQKDNDKLTFLKAIQNIGSAYKTVTNSLKQLHNCALNTDVPFSVNIAALQALQKIEICEEKLACNYMYRRLVPMLKDPSWDVELRIVIYEVLMSNIDKTDFAEDLAKLLKEEAVYQLKSYIATSVKKYIEESEKSGKHKRFIIKFWKECERYEVDIDSIIIDPKRNSNVFAQQRFVNLPFLPEEISGFGSKLEIKTIYGLLSSLPQTVSLNLTLELFSKVFNLFEISTSARGWKELALLLRSVYQKDATLYQQWMEFFLTVLPYITNDFVPEEADHHLDLLDPAFGENIQKLKNAYFEAHKKMEPFLMTDIKLFGNNLNFFTLLDVFGLTALSSTFDPSKVSGSLEEGYFYNSTRVIRIIEAYHQVPTMMGLPLNWTTNATLAYALHIGLQVNSNYADRERKAKFFIHPSGALTFLNRMVLDFPTVTQIGVQANSSAYTSTQWAWDMIFEERTFLFQISLQRPEKSQKFLELYRTNQLIKDNIYEEIEDWDIDRKYVSKCTDDTISAVIGMRICHEKSYADVTNRIKPWFLMAGWAKWKLEMIPFDRDLKSYNLALVTSIFKPHNEVKLKFNAPGELYKREIIFILNGTNNHNQVNIHITIPERPNFDAIISFMEFIDKDIESGSGFKISFVVKLSSGHKYQFTYSNFDGEDNRNGNSTHIDHPIEEKLKEKVNKKAVTFHTPFNLYQWTCVLRKLKKTIKVDSLLSYENFDKEWMWLGKILPSVFWEDSKAWIQIQTDWDIAEHYRKDSFHHHTTTYVHIPYSTIRFITHSLKMHGRSHFHVNASKTEIATGNLLTFANFSYDSWATKNGDVSKHVFIYNATIARLSWALKYVRITEIDTQLYNVTLSRIKMNAKEPADKHYIGWIDRSNADKFTLSEMHSQLSVHLTQHSVGKTDTPEEVVNFFEQSNQQLKEDAYNGRTTIADILLFYPYKGKDESVTFNGKFIKMGSSVSSNFMSFQKDFILKSSYHNLQLDSHSVYSQPSINNVDLMLFHKSFFTHFTTGNKAYYSLNLHKGMKDGCTFIDFNHKITSRVYDLSSFIKLYCQPKSSDVRLEIGVDTHSSYWNVLNSHLRQIFYNHFPLFLGGESMNFSSPLMTINVTANWDEKAEVVHHKKAVLISKSDNIPDMEINIKDLSNGYKEAVFQVNYEEQLKFMMHRQFSNNFKKSHYIFSHKFGVEKEEQDLEMNVKLQNPYQISTDGKLNIHVIYRLYGWLQEKLTHLKHKIIAAAEDPNHPINEMVKPNIKTTLAEYWKSVREEINERETVVKENIYEALETFSSFYEPSFKIVANCYNEAKKLLQKADEKFRLTVPGWAFYYFDLSTVLHDLLKSTPDGLLGLSRIYTRGSLNGTTIGFSNHMALPLYLNSFREYPIVKDEFYKEWIWHQRKLTTDISIRNKKVGLIFGSLHVYTFDGLFYEHPTYPSSECTVLLAHDLYGSSFSAITRSELLHLSFPEMSLTIGPTNDVYINGSKEQQALPLESTNGKITVKREGRILIIISPGLEVACDGGNMLCAFVLSELHNGGTFGLLGNADGEIFNELQLPDGTFAEGIASMIKTFEISGKEDCWNFKNPVKPSWDDYEEKQCSGVIESRCLQVLGTAPAFKEACLWDLSKEGKPCYTSSGLSALCYFQNMKTKSQCETLPDKNEVKQQLEVVVIVNEHYSLISSGSNKILKGLESILNAIENKFHTEGYSSIMYSLVGFGGKGLRCKPHLVTLKSALWVPYKDITNTLKTLRFDGTVKCDVLQGLQYAIDYLGFDTMNSKVLLLFTLEDTKVQSGYTKKLHLIQQNLEANGLTLYTFASYPSIQKGKKVFGVRADGLIFSPAEKDEHAYIDYPKGMLAKLTSATRGSLFLKKFVEENKPSNFFTTVAEEIWAKVHHEVKKCRQCELEEGLWWNMRKKCPLQVCGHEK